MEERMPDPVEKKLLRVLKGETLETPPIWLMRQAGRYLPEYRELRSRVSNFIEFCYTPSIATEATLQPIRRYGFDASILFADILLILDAMDRNLRFVQNEGPVLDPIEKASDLEKVSKPKQLDRLSPVFETVDRLHTALPKETTLIGFAGSAWTVAVYAIEGRGGTDKRLPRQWIHERPDELKAVLRIIADTTIDYLEAQVKAGAEVLMLFDSWAEGLPELAFHDVVIEPTKYIVDHLRARNVDVPIIGFPRGCGAMLPIYAKTTGVQAIGLDTSQPSAFINSVIGKDVAVQGQLDPLSLIAGGEQMNRGIDHILNAYRNRPFIFNLGHGILPQTPPEHVTQLIECVRNGA